MQTWDALSSRRNVRQYTPDPVPAADLDRILEAARRTPSSKNTQPWDFIVVTDLGIGTGHSAVGDQDLAREVLGYPADRGCGYLISFGYPADRPLRPIVKPTRRPFDEVVHRDRWRPEW